MAIKNQAPVGSRWQFNNERNGRVFVVTGRKPGGVVEIKQEDRAYFGQSYLRDLLRNAVRLSDASRLRAEDAAA